MSKAAFYRIAHKTPKVHVSRRRMQAANAGQDARPRVSPSAKERRRPMWLRLARVRLPGCE